MHILSLKQISESLPIHSVDSEQRGDIQTISLIPL